MESQETDDRKITISKEELGNLPTAQFDGEVILVDEPEQVDGAIADLRESDIIGFDTETRPSFKKGLSNRVSLMQLANRKRCYLFRLNKIGMPDSLRNLLEDPGLLKVGLSIHDDFHNLRRICELNPEGFVDLQPYVKQYRIADNSLSKIYAIVFGQRISKGQRLTNWEADVLTSTQCRYAALDAIACISIYDEVTSGAFHPLQSPYLREVENEAPHPAPATVAETEAAPIAPVTPAEAEAASMAPVTVAEAEAAPAAPVKKAKKRSAKPMASRAKKSAASAEKSDASAKPKRPRTRRPKAKKSTANEN